MGGLLKKHSEPETAAEDKPRELDRLERNTGDEEADRDSAKRLSAVQWAEVGAGGNQLGTPAPVNAPGSVKKAAFQTRWDDLRALRNAKEKLLVMRVPFDGLAKEPSAAFEQWTAWLQLFQTIAADASALAQEVQSEADKLDSSNAQLKADLDNMAVGLRGFYIDTIGWRIPHTTQVTVIRQAQEFKLAVTRDELGGDETNAGYFGAIDSKYRDQLIKAGILSSEWDDDPLLSTPFGDDESLRARTGPVRTTLIRPTASREWIRAFLTEHKLAPSMAPGGGAAGDLCSFDGRQLTRLADVLEAVRAKAAEASMKVQETDFMSAVNEFLHPVKPGAKSGVLREMYLSYSVNPLTFEQEGEFGYTFVLHPKDKAGMEITIIGTGSLARKNEHGKHSLDLTMLAGGEIAYADKLNFGGQIFALSVFAKALLGAIHSRQRVVGSMALEPVTSFAAKAGAGVELMWEVPGTNGKLKIGGEYAGALVGPADPQLHPEAEHGPSIVLKVEF